MKKSNVADKIRFYEKKGVMYVEIVEQGKRHRFVYNDDIEVDEYVRRVRAGEPKKAAKAFRAYEKRLRKNKPLKSIIQKGSTTVRTTLEELKSRDAIQNVYRQLFRPLVKDDQLLNIIVQNKHKLRSRYAYTIMPATEEGSHIGSITDIGRYTIEEMIHAYRTTLNYRPGTVIQQGDMANHAKSIGLDPKCAKQGRYGDSIGRVDLIITFRRG